MAVAVAAVMVVAAAVIAAVVVVAAALTAVRGQVPAATAEGHDSVVNADRRPGATLFTELPLGQRGRRVSNGFRPKATGEDASSTALAMPQVEPINRLTAITYATRRHAETPRVPAHDEP